MSLVGSLREFPFLDLLQFLSTAERTGKLSLTRADRQGLVIFRRGRILYATSTAVHETLGSLLVSRGLVGEEELQRALDAQHDSTGERRLGNVLVDLEMIDRGRLEEVLQQKILRLMKDFSGWEGAFFKFEAVEIPDRGEVEVDLHDFLMAEGISADKIMIDLAALEEEEPTAAAADGEKPAARSLALLMGELPSPSLTGELVARILRCGRSLAPRSLLFKREGDHWVCRAGLDREGVYEDPSGLVIPVAAPSVLSRAANELSTYRGGLFASVGNRRVEALLGEEPTEVIVVPLVVGRVVELLYYGDDGGVPGSLEDPRAMEIILLKAGIAMEQALLEGKKAALAKLLAEEDD
ncbi:MAG: DUF4388 domain-containing protein [Thermoanaerobaculia bacterium]|nr:DUF4388 domain-containing protein [Thermoanaerobaculia bacterium]